MSVCASGCGAIPIQWSSICPKQKRKGGVPYIVNLSCEYDPTEAEINDPDWWCSLPIIIAGNPVSISPVLLGNKPESTFTTEQQTSCGTPERTGQTNKIEFTSTEMENTATGLRTTWFKDYNYWNDLNDNYHRYKFGYIDCDGRFWGFLSNVSFQATYIIPPLSTGLAMWKGEISWTGREEKPYFIPNLVNLLSGGCP